MLQAIDDTSIDQTLAVLLQGFPERSEAFWRHGLERARAFTPHDTGWPLGYLLRHDNRSVGVMLTFASHRREAPETAKTVVNLSSWYVEPALRGMAPLMFMKVIGGRNELFTDLTPTPDVLRMLPRLKFTNWNEGLVLTSWPQTLAVPRRRATILPLRQLPKDALDEARHILLEDHERLGCLAAALDDGECWHPLVFLRRRIKRVPCGYLIYASSRRKVLSHLRLVTAFLLRHGMPVFCLDADRAERPPGSLFFVRENKAFRGLISRDRVDYAYSEIVYLNL